MSAVNSKDNVEETTKEFTRAGKSEQFDDLAAKYDLDKCVEWINARGLERVS